MWGCQWTRIIYRFDCYFYQKIDMKTWNGIFRSLYFINDIIDISFVWGCTIYPDVILIRQGQGTGALSQKSKIVSSSVYPHFPVVGINFNLLVFILMYGRYLCGELFECFTNYLHHAICLFDNLWYQNVVKFWLMSNLVCVVPYLGQCLSNLKLTQCLH